MFDLQHMTLHILRASVKILESGFLGHGGPGEPPLTGPTSSRSRL